MLAKMTSKNQVTLPKSVTASVGATEYFEVEARGGQIILTPVRIQRGDAVRATEAAWALDPTNEDVGERLPGRGFEPQLLHASAPALQSFR